MSHEYDPFEGRLLPIHEIQIRSSDGTPHHCNRPMADDFEMFLCEPCGKVARLRDIRAAREGRGFSNQGWQTSHHNLRPPFAGN
ncbi:hypothetical protein [Kitasatospora mediocidica]|uniref:hypothetical protein n=1 Tax=Kitasatospora mediocidica TaxID=58352 RepID=UPI00056BC8AE|nr:hypothetical protein [Kitasatospora mediocidica]